MMFATLDVLNKIWGVFVCYVLPLGVGIFFLVRHLKDQKEDNKYERERLARQEARRDERDKEAKVAVMAEHRHTDEGWVCRFCTHLNNPQARQCDRCEASWEPPRDRRSFGANDLDMVEKPRAAVMMTPPKATTYGWICPNCQEHNMPGNLSCWECDTRKPDERYVR